jgi:hypothetical protein
MKCKRCGWSTSSWQRDLWSGLCVECQKIDRASPQLDASEAVRQALWAHASRCLEHGEPVAELEQKLAATGLAPQDAAAVVGEAVSRRAHYMTANKLLDRGTGLLDVRKKLVESGLAPEAAAAVIEEVQEARSGVRADGSPGRRRMSNITAAQGVVLAVAVVIFMGMFIAGAVVSLATGGLASFGYFLAGVGQIWLLVLIVRECQPSAVGYALLIPFFTWYFAHQRWDIAKWALCCNLAGVLLLMLGLCSGA